MVPECEFLIQFTNGKELFKVALRVDANKLKGDAFEYPMEPENKEQYKQLLGIRWNSCAVLSVETINDIVVIL